MAVFTVNYLAEPSKEVRSEIVIAAKSKQELARQVLCGNRNCEKIRPVSW